MHLLYGDFFALYKFNNQSINQSKSAFRPCLRCEVSDYEFDRVSNNDYTNLQLIACFIHRYKSEGLCFAFLTSLQK
jgi:hypothetical protein